MRNDALPKAAETIRVFIENTAGSSTKRTYDETTLEFLKSDTVSAPYPFAYGFLPDTIGGDGDCLDCFVVTDVPMVSGTVIECVPVHLLEQVEDGETDHKILAVPAGTTVQVAETAVVEIRSFIGRVFSHVPGKKILLGPLLGAFEARRYIESCHKNRL